MHQSQTLRIDLGEVERKVNQISYPSFYATHKKWNSWHKNKYNVDKNTIHHVAELVNVM